MNWVWQKRNDMTKGVVAVLFVFILCSLYNDSLAQIYRANRLRVVKAELLGAVAFHILPKNLNGIYGQE